MAHGHETATEIIGTDGRLTVGRDGRLNHVEIADTHGVRTLTTPTFYERFADAFLREETHFVDCVRHERPLALTLHDATEATRIGIALRDVAGGAAGRRVVTGVVEAAVPKESHVADPYSPVAFRSLCRRYHSCRGASRGSGYRRQRPASSN
jgi:hypothetical protein